MDGFYLDYYALGFLGLGSYSVFCTYGLFFDENATGKIDLNDLVFTYCGVLALIVISGQFFIYPHGRNKMSTLMKISLVVILGFFCIYGILTLVQFHLFRALTQSAHPKGSTSSVCLGI